MKTAQQIEEAARTAEREGRWVEASLLWADASVKHSQDAVVLMEKASKYANTAFYLSVVSLVLFVVAALLRVLS